MAQIQQDRKPGTVNHLALIIGLIASVEIGEIERDVIDKELDKAVDAAKKSFHERNDRKALEAQVHLESL